MASVTIRFADETFAPCKVEQGQPLSESLDAVNSPVLFGCRTGLCSTCVVEVSADAPVPPADEDEQEILDTVCPGNSRARLACRLEVVTDMILCADVEGVE